MKHIIVALLFVLNIGTILNTNSQNQEFTKENYKLFPDFKKAKKNLRKGDVYYNELNVMNQNLYTNYAIFYYKKAYEINSNSAVLNYKIANSYSVSLNKKEGLKYALKAYDLNPNLNDHLLFVLGASYQNNGHFDKAEQYFQQYISKSAHQDSVVLAKKHIEEIANAKMFINNPNNIAITSLSIANTEYAEYAPFVNQDSSILYFTSRQPQSELDIAREDGFAESIYYSRAHNGVWTAPILLDVKHNQGRRRNLAFIGFNYDVTKIYIYTSKNNGSILEGKYENGSIKKLKMMPTPINSKKYTESHISFTKDGKTAYFISDREGGSGGKDVWKATKIDEKKWSAPINLGSSINSPYDEDGAYIHPDGKKLYLSSKGFNSAGGYDIFIANVDSAGNIGALTNLGYPINGYDDDVFFAAKPSKNLNYFSSIKPDSKGLIDIYYFDDSQPDSIVNIFVKVFDAENGDSIAAKIKIYDYKNQLLDTINWTANNKNIKLVDNKKYVLQFEADNYEPVIKNIDLTTTKDKDPKEIQAGLMRKQQPTKEEPKSVDTDIVKLPIHLQNVYFEFDKSSLTAEAKSILDQNVKTLKENEALRVVIFGFTDSKGSDEYNLNLSRRRANAVVVYLSNKGISRHRIASVEGKGESNPIAENDTEEGRSKNRRTEINIYK